MPHHPALKADHWGAKGLPLEDWMEVEVYRQWKKRLHMEEGELGDLGVDEHIGEFALAMPGAAPNIYSLQLN